MVETINVETDAEQYSDLADEIRNTLEAKERRRQASYSHSSGVTYDVTVDSWHEGPLVYVVQNGGDKIPSFDRNWVGIALRAGYLPHGHICDPDGSNMRWYLRPLDELEDMQDTAETLYENIKEYVPFESYLKDQVGIGEPNVVTQIGDDTYHIEHEWFTGGELEALTSAEGAVLQGVNAEDEYAVVEDAR